jgi:hypothetical protein
MAKMEPKTNPFATAEEVKVEAKEPNVATDAMSEILDRLDKLEKENAELKK